jgi:hypothetical protein
LLFSKTFALSLSIKEQFQKRDNIEEFGTKTVWHEPKVIHQNLETIGFAKIYN